jgi:hypothetical protein
VLAELASMLPEGEYTFRLQVNVEWSRRV